jgi:transketolase
MDIQSLQTHARHVRQDIIKMTAKAGAGHPGGSLSLVVSLIGIANR